METTKCPFCEKEIRNPGSLASHRKRCEMNPEKVTWETAQKGRVPWNKGLTKETHSSIDKYSNTLRGRKGLDWTEEMRRKQSELKKKFYEDNPEKHPNRILAGNLSKMTYPETVAHSWFLRKGIQAEHNQRVGSYYPDFLIGSVIVEIDGERWHPEGCERDKGRDEKLRAMGFEVHHIPSSDCIEDRLAEIFNENLDPNSFTPRVKGKSPLVPKKMSFPPDKVKERFSKVENAGVDIHSFGWVSKVAKIWKVSHTQVRRFYELYWEGEKPFTRSKKPNNNK